MEGSRQDAGSDIPGYFVWEAPGKPVAVHLSLEVVDNLLADVMRGFGAVPKRGAEVGGVLLGAIESDGSRTVVKVDDVAPVECSYTHGPSYLFNDEEAAAFTDTCQRWRPDTSMPRYAVGYFRSHTRDGLSLALEDVELMDHFFPESDRVALLIRPFATKASMAGFFVREDGVFPEKSPLEFPFRRRDLSGEEPPPRRALTERRRESEAAAAIAEAPAAQESGRPRARMAGWMWVPLCFVFLALGVLLGYEAAVTVGGRTAAGAPGGFPLALTVTRDADNLTVRWSREAPAIKNAQRGVLEIEDGGYSKPVDLDAAHLQNGSIIYRNSSNSVRFRLVVYLNSRLSVTETLDWSQ